MENIEIGIKRKLAEIEKNENVRIIYAAESGSRAWGFASPNSDYDVRFVYVRCARDYLRIDEIPDVIEWQLDEVYDVNGWDLKKFLGLLCKSNQTCFEWARSPIVYRSTENWRSISAAMDDYFDPKGAMYHYLSLAENNNRYLKGEKVKLKKYFYVLRPLLACRFIEERQAPPPILFGDLARSYLPERLRPEVSRMLALKGTAAEKEEFPRSEILAKYIESEMTVLKNAANSMQPRKKTGIKRLNELFQMNAEK